MEAIFSWSSLLAMPFWMLMAFFPRARLTERLMRGVIGPALPALLYLALVLPNLGDILPMIVRPDLEGVASLLGTPAGATIAWAHFLAFDLFVGRWIYLDSRRRGLNPIVAAPILFLTLVLGPVGLVTYLAVRSASLRLRNDPAVRAFLARLWDTSPALLATAAAHVALLGVFLLGIALDDRTLLGEPVWLKPTKFAASIALYTFTLAWMLSFVQGRHRAVRAIGWVTAITMAIEIVIIGAQAGRGVRSHFNVATAMDTALFSVMGAAIATATLAGLATLVLLFRQRMEDRALAWALRLGLLVSILGASLGGMMTRPRAEQLEQLNQGLPAYAGAHAVGVPDGGGGLPVVGWSTEGGDLRVPHFAGLHAMQLLPLVAVWLARGHRGRRFDARQRLRLVAAASIGYGGTVALLAWQALRGEPLTAPGTLTLASFAALAVIVAGVSLSARAGRRAHQPLAPALSR